MNFQTCEPIGGFTPPAELEALEGRVQCLMNGRVRNLRLLFHQDGLILKGFSRSYYAKQIAQHAVMNRTNLPILANEIEVT
jgi:hypothetical protein